jgi:hypothetical protein
MISESDLRDAERKNYLYYFEDGILDIIAGLPVLSFGLGMVFDATLLFIFTWLPMILYWPLKQVIALPRMGYVKFNPARRRKISKNMVLLLIAGTASLILGIAVNLGFENPLFNLREFMMKYSLLILGAVMASAFVLISILFELRRFFGYGVLVFMGWLVPFLFPIREGVPVALIGGLISLLGVGIMVRFLISTAPTME